MRPEQLLKPWVIASLVLAACSSVPPVPVVNKPTPAVEKPVFDETVPGPAPVLAYYQTLAGMTTAQLGRERMVLAALPNNPNTQLRVAMLLGHPRGPIDLARAVGLLDGILKSSDPAAVQLHAIARLMADNYQERQKLDGQLDRGAAQLKEAQRKSLELQEKLDGLAEIERTLPTRPARTRGIRPNGQP